MTTATFTCETCYDTKTIDHGGREVPCPDCVYVEIRLTGLPHSLGLCGAPYGTCVDFTSSTMTFRAPTVGRILSDVAAVTRSVVCTVGSRKRDSRSSWAIAIERRVREAAGL